MRRKGQQVETQRACLIHRRTSSSRFVRSPSVALLWSVLQDGMETYRKYTGATSGRGQRLFAGAERWIMENDPTWLCSFVSICHVLELDSGHLRAGLQRWRTTTFASELRQAA